MPNPTRSIAGTLALTLGIGLVTAAAPSPPADSVKKAVEADIAFLQKSLNGGKPEKRAMPTIKASAMVLAMYGEMIKDDGLRSQALKVAAAAAKKDWVEADAAAKDLAAAKPDPAAPKGALSGLYKFDLDETMSAFRPGKTGGMNIEKDMKEQMKMTTDVKVLELVGVRTAALAYYTAAYPNQKAAASPAAKAKWDNWSKEMGTLGEQIAKESAKGAGADKKALTTLLKKLDANCSNCHNAFRDD